MRRRRKRSRAAAEEGGRCLWCERLRAGRTLVALLALVPCLGRAEEPAGTTASRDALALCHEAQSAPSDAQEELLERSLARADAAIAADEGDPLAHFARFCALGQQARRSGASLSSLVKLWAIRDAVDRTLELAPDFPDALLGKGALLSSVPRLLGGDPEEGERLVRRALQIDPDYVGARLFLAESYAEHDRKAEARVEAALALEAAGRKDDPEGVADAQRVMAELARDGG
jgi:hypothetical protein